MTTPSLKILGGLCLILPSLLLAGNLHTKMNALQAAETVRLPLGGYDPVSLLHGHYVRIQFDRPAILESESTCTTATCCLCFNQNIEGAWKAKKIACEPSETASCARVTNNTALLYTAHEYYVDEREAPRLDALLQNATRAAWQQSSAERLKKEGKEPSATEPQPVPKFEMDVAVLKSGETKFKMLFIDGLPFRDYLKQNK